MKIRHHKATFAAAVAGLLLAGCATSDEADSSLTPGSTGQGSEGTADNAASLESVTWNEDDAGVPTLEFDAPLNITGSAGRVVNEGDGDAVEDGQAVSLHYTVTGGADGSTLYSTYEADAPETLLLTEGSLDPVLADLLRESNVGADLLYAVVDTASVDAAGMPETILMAATVASTSEVLDRAEGSEIEPAEGLPVVTLDEVGAPSVEMPESEPPTELVAQTLIEGDGAEVEEGASIVAHYSGWLWNGEQFDSSWDRGAPFLANLAGGVIEGWTQGLVGQTVGSQVLLVVPPELGYGDTGNASIPGGSTLVFVVDILAAS